MSKFQNYLKTFDITSTLTEEDIDKTLALLQIYGPAVRRTASRIGEMEEECYEGRRQSISDFINLAIDYDRDTDRKRIADRLAEIDIGGFTIDVLKLRSGHPDLAVVESFEKGVITLYNGIASKCNALYARILEDCDIDEVIRNQPTVLPGEVQQLIRTMTSDFLTEFYNFLRERGVDVSTSKCVFAGGGSLLLRGMIERGNKVAFPIFIEDIHANARGYELLYQSEVAANGQQ